MDKYFQCRQSTMVVPIWAPLIVELTNFYSIARKKRTTKYTKEFIF